MLLGALYGRTVIKRLFAIIIIIIPYSFLLSSHFFFSFSSPVSLLFLLFLSASSSSSPSLLSPLPLLFLSFPFLIFLPFPSSSLLLPLSFPSSSPPLLSSSPPPPLPPCPHSISLNRHYSLFRNDFKYVIPCPCSFLLSFFPPFALVNFGFFSHACSLFIFLSPLLSSLPALLLPFRSCSFFLSLFTALRHFRFSCLLCHESCYFF